MNHNGIIIILGFNGNTKNSFKTNTHTHSNLVHVNASNSMSSYPLIKALTQQRDLVLSIVEYDEDGMEYKQEPNK
jgi:hypothetical protein